ncbi:MULTISPECIES: YciI family protein [unclassified Fusibacter]|uniref:YciI family protein n=1 Tax=unclassified Fusibacter TaxID=2624464 RepID=UPI001012B68B|nr:MULTISPECIES: YciI family protein [unclassified Fusibacter]MCK8059312.1 YciI family protein [Fusibacter sp. A2]NPE21224.1 hypothetical protein [Fusibacter sp. A1]RXV62492.1 hypothetical protein DWB64_05260 [Fusibacter sp. A1]
MKQYLYMLKLVDRIVKSNTWTKEDEEIVGEHFLNLKTLTEKGVVLLAGKTDRETDDGFGIVILKADSKEQAEEIMRKDPAVKKGIMTATLFEYQIALESISRGELHD